MSQGRYTAGMGTHYEPSLICGPPVHQDLARGFVVEERFQSAPVVRLADSDDEGGPTSRFTPENADGDAVIVLRVVVQQGHRGAVRHRSPHVAAPPSRTASALSTTRGSSVRT